jgi:hypothetical protein
MEVPPGQDGCGDKDQAEDLVAAEGAEMRRATGFGFCWVELRLGAVGHGGSGSILSPHLSYLRTQVDLARLDCRP